MSNHNSEGAPSMKGKFDKELKSLIVNAPAAIALLEGHKHVYTFVNTTYQKLYSRSEDQLIGHSLRDVFPELEGQGIHEIFDNVFCTGEPFTANEFPATFEDNGVTRTGYYNFTIQPIQDDHKIVTGLMVHAYEVTRQVEAYKKAEENEVRYRSLFDNMDHGCAVIEVIFDEHTQPIDYRFLEVNPVFESQTGLTNPTGKKARQLIPELEQHWVDIYGNIAITGVSGQFSEYSEVMGRWFDVNAFKVGANTSKEVAIIFRDITSRKRTEKEIQDTKSLLQTVYDSAPNGIAVLETIYDQNGRVDDFIITLFNEYTRNWIGNVEYKGRRYSELFPLVRQTGILDRFKEVALTGAPDKFEQWYEGEGMRHWFRFTVVKRGELLVVTTEDISAAKNGEKTLRESEERFAAAVEAVEGIVWTNSPDGQMEGLQPGWSKLTGQSFEEYKGFGWATAVHPDDAAPTIDAWKESVRLQRTFKFEHRLRTANNEWRTFLIKAIPLKDPDSSIRQWVGVHTDITEQREAERRLQESERRYRLLSEKLEAKIEVRTLQLRQSNDDLQQFAHVTSHDLKEPVRKIKIFTDLLQSEFAHCLEGKGNLYLDKVQNATNRMVSMIDGVLAYSSMNAMELSPEIVDLNDIIENIKSDLELVIQEKNAKIIYNNLPRIEGARVLFYQLFYNLINNALKFGRQEQSVIVNIDAEIFPDNDKKAVRILVQDNGIGFDQKFAETIFNTFTRLNPKDKYEGTGLGLALCKKIVERHGGKIKAHSAKGQGATFNIVLPVKRSNNNKV